jgi:DNA polymerase I-like protein with 3'-5' exonuclease and polymerase domains
MVGIALGTSDGWKRYYPFAHAEGDQFEKEKVIRYCKEQLCRENQPKVGANILYDLDYLAEEGVKVQGPFHDILLAEPLIDENQRFFNLDSVANKYLGEGKDEKLMDDYVQRQGWRGKAVKHLWRIPPEFVGVYAEADVDRTIRSFIKQYPILKRDDLLGVYDIESRLIPYLLKMRRQGVRVNYQKTEMLVDKTEKRIKDHLKQIHRLSGVHVDLWAATSLAKAFDRLGLKYPKTAKTKAPSFTAPWLERHSHELAGHIREARKLEKFCGTFLKGQILGLHINGRLHPSFNQLKGDEYGTVTGRFSCSLPNLQFIPARDPELGPLTRSLFIPEEAHYWGRADYSQIEIRILAHYARGHGASDIRRAFINDAKLDYHQWCADVAGISRKQAKTINFGLIYGMGAAKLAPSLGITIEESIKFIKMYQRKLPFLQSTTEKAMRVAAGRGYVRTILGRRRRFDMWEPRDWKLARADGSFRGKDKDEVREKLRSHIQGLREQGLQGKDLPRLGVQRAGTYKAFNAVDQGSAADIMKKAMVDIYESGITDELKTHITVHDELDLSIPKTPSGEEAFKEMQRLMENTIPLKVPTPVDSETGPNWGECK